MRGVALLGALALIGVGCGSDPEGSGPRVRPGLSPVVLGNLVLNAGDPAAPGCSTGVAPCQWVLRIQSVGTSALTIDEVCIEGNSRSAFSMEGPDITEVDPDTDALVRITYDHDDLDAGRSIDNIAVVVQSNARDFPTLVVPVCGRMLDANDPQPDPVECTTPVPAPAEGESDDTLCAN